MSKTTTDHPMASKHMSGEPEEKTEVRAKPEEELNIANMGDLKDLIFLGRLEATVIAENFKFKLRTLSSNENRKVLSTLMKLEDRLMNLKIVILSMALREINGVKLSEIFDSWEIEVPDVSTDQEKAMYIISNLQTSVIDLIFGELEELNKRAEAMFKAPEEEKKDFLEE